MAKFKNIAFAPVAYQLALWFVLAAGIFLTPRPTELPAVDFLVFGQIILGLLPLVATVYTNHYLLVPHFLQKQKHSFYWATLVALITLAASFDWFYPYFPYPQSSFFTLWGLHLLLILSAMSLYLIRKFAFHQQREFELLLRQNEMEMQLLRSQMNPHFLFNALNSIYSYALEGSDRAADLIIELSQLTRYQLESSRKGMLPLADEIEFLHNFLSLEETLPSDKFQRIHKSYIINLSKVDQAHGKMVTINEQELPVGNAYRQQLLERLGN
ncbi:histidine kinase [Tunicatimonas pelagia]|uniref:histidine kinase n=1 Tax=Tunicatimonas pelagia TaxID=931531 RepID=UPI0026670435|nr:histidine kinase [Tunicatimonas pelagia]WKN43344.1 histidine kinase [Tunicatimonas pelagia]